MELVLRLLSGEMGQSDGGPRRTKAMTLRFSVFDQLAKVWSVIEEERIKVELQKDNLYKLAKDSDKGALERIFPTYRAVRCLFFYNLAARHRKSARVLSQVTHALSQ